MHIQGKLPELLIPASDLETLKVAVHYGADAVYIGGEAFSLRAKARNFSEEDMPKALVVISDMEIDHYVSYYGLDFVGEQVVKYANAGFNFPKLILWNVESRQDTFLTKDKNVIMVSGQSPSTFKNLLAGVEGKTSWDVLLETLLDPMYEMVTI